MLNKIDHIGIAVANLDDSLSLFRDVLGMEYLGLEPVPSQKVNVGIMRVGGIRIELLQPTSEDSPVAKFLAKRGSGFHHIAFQVDDLQEALKRCEAQGLKPIDRDGRAGAAGARVAFLDPKSTGGILTELTTGSRGSGGGCHSASKTETLQSSLSIVKGFFKKYLPTSITP